MSNETGTTCIIVITTGGTIAQEYDKELGGCVPKKSGQELLESIRFKIDVESIELIDFSMIDSREIDLEFLYNLSKLVQEKINDQNVKGIVIIHGTDTMVITAYFLHRTVNCSNKSIVITGAMRVSENSDYDGIANLINAITQVYNLESTTFGAGVSVNFAGKIHSPVSIFKKHSFAIDPFSSGDYGVIGMMHHSKIHWSNNPKRSLQIPLPEKLESVLSVPIVYAYPGATINLLDGFIQNGFKALIVVAYGSGNVSTKMFSAIKKAIKNGVRVVLVTCCRYGGVYAEYGGTGGNQSLKDIGVIMAEDLNPYQAMVVASLVIGNEKIHENNVQIYFSNKNLE